MTDNTRIVRVLCTSTGGKHVSLLTWNFDTSNIPRDCALILAGGDKSQTVTKSRWSEKRGAFEGFQPDSLIIAWMYYPEHPYKAMAAMSAPQEVPVNE